jgi:ATP-binding protein involved in chromosome partitioning
MDISKVKTLLAGIKVPGAEQDIADAGVITEVEFEGGELTVVLHFADVTREDRHHVEDAVVARLQGQEGVTEVFVEVEVDNLPDAADVAKREEGLSVHGGGGASVQPPEKALRNVRNIIAVASGKGGVGKSTVAVNLALALKARGATVGILDLDIYGPSVPIQLGVPDAKPGVTADQKLFAPVEAYGLEVMSIGFLVDDDTPVIWRGPIVSSVVKQFLEDVAWGTLDYLVIDMPPGTGDAQLTLTQSAPITGAVIVTTPSELALVDAVKGLQMFRKVDTPVLGIVENMSHYVCPSCSHESQPFNSGGTARVAEKTGAAVLTSIPIDIEIQRGGDEGKPLMAVRPDAPQAAAFFELADAVISKVPFEANNKPEKKGFLSGLFKR